MSVEQHLAQMDEERFREIVTDFVREQHQILDRLNHIEGDGAPAIREYVWTNIQKEIGVFQSSIEMKLRNPFGRRDQVGEVSNKFSNEVKSLNSLWDAVVDQRQLVSIKNSSTRS